MTDGYDEWTALLGTISRNYKYDFADQILTPHRDDLPHRRQKVMVAADRTKNKSSMRTLPLVPFFKERLFYLQDQQNKQRRLCGRSYCRDYLGYICVDEIGVLIKPDYISAVFPKLLDSRGLRRIRFHELSHSCASLLLANGAQMKDIQDWLGHSDFSTTANVYSHLDYTAKLNSAETLVTSLDFAPAPKLLPG